jgi:hypothetical protein
MTLPRMAQTEPMYDEDGKLFYVPDCHGMCYRQYDNRDVFDDCWRACNRKIGNVGWGLDRPWPAWTRLWNDVCLCSGDRLVSFRPCCYPHPVAFTVVGVVAVILAVLVLAFVVACIGVAVAAAGWSG